MTTSKSKEALDGIISDFKELTKLLKDDSSVATLDTFVSAYIAIGVHWTYIRKSEGHDPCPEFELKYKSKLVVSDKSASNETVI